MARFSSPRSTLNELGLTMEVVRGQADFYAAYARQLERSRRSPANRDVWTELANPAQEWQGRATLAATYRLAAQYTALLDPRRAGLLAFRSAMAYLELRMPFGALLALGLLPNRMLDRSTARSRIVGPARSMMAEPAEHNPVQQMYLYFIATGLPGVASTGTVGNLRQSLDAHQLHPVGAQGLPLMNYLDLADSMSREETSDRLDEMSAVAPRLPQERTIESLASIGRQQAFSLRSAQQSGYLWNKGAAPVDIIDLELVAINCLVMRSQARSHEDAYDAISNRLSDDDPLSELSTWAAYTLYQALQEDQRSLQSILTREGPI